MKLQLRGNSYGICHCPNLNIYMDSGTMHRIGSFRISLICPQVQIIVPLISIFNIHILKFKILPSDLELLAVYYCFISLLICIFCLRSTKKRKKKFIIINKFEKFNDKNLLAKPNMYQSSHNEHYHSQQYFTIN